MTPQELKNSILQLAIQGKLVEQRAEEGTGKELLEKILAAKNAEGANAKGKGEKSHAKSAKSAKVGSRVLREEIPDDEKPFDIPESWEWVRLGEVGSLTRGSGIKRTETRESGYPCIRYGELYTTYKIRFSITKSFVDEPLYDISKKISNGDIVMTLTGENKTDIATAVVYEGQDEIAMGGDMTCWSHHGMESLYLVYLMNSPYAIGCKRKLATGDIIVHISNEKLSSILLPLPPLAEQKRIVAKIEELMPLVERYEKAWSKLKDLNKRFPADMQKSLLQMAIQGKLVEQRAEEGTGRGLLEKILAAKNAEGAKGRGNKLTRSRGARGGGEEGELSKLPKADKSHLSNTLSAPSASPRDEIPDDEKPFDIPESWEWARLGEVVDVRDGTHDTPKYVQAGVPLVTSKNLVSGTIDFTTAKFISYEDSKAINIRSGVDDGDILFAMIGTIGNPVLIRKDREFSIKNMALFKPIDRGLFCMEYLMMFLTKAQFDMRKSASASVQSFVSLSFLRNYPIPLPPLAEQKRIVAKLEELLPLCERLK